MNIILFDPEHREALLPIAFTRPVADIRVGALTIKEKWELEMKQESSFQTQDYLAKKFPVKIENDNTYINGSLFPSKELTTRISNLKMGEALVKDNVKLAFRTGSEISISSQVEFEGECKILQNTWDIIQFLSKELKADLERLKPTFLKAEIPEYCTAIKPENIFVQKAARIGACILNASEGEIFISKDAEIMDGAIVKGPVFLGEHSAIKMGAKIYGPVSTGCHCKIGGEICDTVFQAYSSKGHDGFVGHSYLGEWCNLGADTNTSNLKNTYDKVRLWNYTTERFDKTGMQFLGVIMGDHVKTGINTMLNTGTVIGVASNVYGGGYIRNFMPSFCQGGASGLSLLPVSNASKIANAAMARRKVEFTNEDESIFRHISKSTSKYRRF